MRLLIAVIAAATLQAALLFGSLGIASAIGFKDQPGHLLASLAVILSPLGAGVFVFIVLSAVIFVALGRTRWFRRPVVALHDVKKDKGNI